MKLPDEVFSFIFPFIILINFLLLIVSFPQPPAVPLLLLHSPLKWKTSYLGKAPFNSPLIFSGLDPLIGTPPTHTAFNGPFDPETPTPTCL